MPKQTKLVLSLYNVLGQKIAEPENDEKQASYHEIILDASKFNLSSGLYFVRLKLIEFKDVIKILHLK